MSLLDRLWYRENTLRILSIALTLQQRQGTWTNLPFLNPLFYTVVSGWTDCEKCVHCCLWCSLYSQSVWSNDTRYIFVGESWFPDRQSRCESHPIAAEPCSWWPGMYREWLGTSERRGTGHAANPSGRRRALHHLRHLPLYIPELYWRKYRAWHELCWLSPGWKRCVRSKYWFLFAA